MIPEFIGRLPVITTLKEFNQCLLKELELKNALIKQFEAF